MKKSFLVLLFFFGITLYYLFEIYDLSDDVNTTEIPEYVSRENIRPTKDEPYDISTDEYKLQFIVKFSTKMMAEKETLGSSDYQYNLAFKKVSETGSEYLGQAFNILWPTDNSGEERPMSLAFTTSFDDGAFNDTNMLGLNSSHPLYSIKHILKQFSYYQGDKSLLFSDAEYDFHYQKNGTNTVSRMLIGTRPLTDSYTLISQDDKWQLIYDNNKFPESLSNLNKKVFDYEGNFLNIIQEIKIEPVSKYYTLDWSLERFSENINANIKTAALGGESESSQSVINSANFEERFQAFSKSPDLLEAKLIGVFLADKGFNYVKSYLENPDTSDNQQSLLIFALERSQEQDGELVLSNIIQDKTIDEQNRLRAMMSIAKMGESNTEEALITLQSALDDSSQVVADSALLNIGIVGGQSDLLKQEVADYLEEKLPEQGQAYTTLLAIDNLKDQQLDEAVKGYLSSSEYDERLIAARVLSRNPEMTPILQKQLLKDDNPSVIQEITEMRLSSTDYEPLSYEYQRAMRDRIRSDELSIVAKEMLFSYLIAGSDQLVSNDKELAEELLQNPELSESFRAELKGKYQD